MPATFHIGLPDERQRTSIFRRILGMERIHEDVDLSRLSKLTEGFSNEEYIRRKKWDLHTPTYLKSNLRIIIAIFIVCKY